MSLSRKAAAALRVEIEVLLGVIIRRDHVSQLGRTISHLSSLAGPPTEDDFYDVMDGTQDTYPVFHANCNKLGLLGGAAESVVAAYLRFKAVDADLHGVAERHRSRPLTRAQLLQVYESANGLLLEGIARADLAVSRLREHEWRRFLWRSRKSR